MKVVPLYGTPESAGKKKQSVQVPSKDDYKEALLISHKRKFSKRLNK